MLFRNVIWNNVNGNHVLFRAWNLKIPIICCWDLIHCRFPAATAPVVKGTYRNVVFTTPVSFCHAALEAFIDKPALFPYLWTSPFKKTSLLIQVFDHHSMKYNYDHYILPSRLIRWKSFFSKGLAFPYHRHLILKIQIILRIVSWSTVQTLHKNYFEANAIILKIRIT